LTQDCKNAEKKITVENIGAFIYVPIFSFRRFRNNICKNQFCGLLDVGNSTRYKLLKSDRIKRFKIGKVWKIPVKSVEAFVLASVNV